MVKICRTGLLELNFEIVPKKRIFRFLPKISAGHGWSWKFFFANFQTLGPLGCQGWVVIPQNVKKSQNHCTLLHTYGCSIFPPWFRTFKRLYTMNRLCSSPGSCTECTLYTPYQLYNICIKKKDQYLREGSYLSLLASSKLSLSSTE